MTPLEDPDAEDVAPRARDLLGQIAEARRKVEGYPGALSGELPRFRDRFDKLIRESEVENYRQVRIFLRDVDDVANELAKAARDRRLGPKHVRIFDVVLSKARHRDFYGARKAWHKLDKVVDQAAEVQQLQSEYRDLFRGVEARVRELRKRVEHSERVPKPPASPSDADGFVAKVDTFNAAVSASYLDFLSRSRADVAIPLLLDTTHHGGVGIPSPPSGSDPEPLLRLLAGAGPGHDEIRARSFYGLLELPGYSDAKLTHLFGDSRMVRTALDSAWAWLKAIREDERRSLSILWSDDVNVLKRRVPSLVAFLERMRPHNDALEQGKALSESLASGHFQTMQTAARLYATHRDDARDKWTGHLEKDAERMRKEAAALAAALKGLPDPDRVAAGELD